MRTPPTRYGSIHRGLHLSPPPVATGGRHRRIALTASSTFNGLWHNRDFMHLWGAETVSQFGSQITPVAIPPLAALMLDATPFEMGILAAASGVPVLVIGFVAGAWVDRPRRRPLMITMDIGRAIALLVIPLAAWLDALSILLLVLVAVVTGTQTVIFNAAYASLLPNRVERSELADANGKLSTSMSISHVAGPAVTGTLSRSSRPPRCS